MTPPAIAQWLDFIERGEVEILDGLLAEDAVFYSPAVFTRKEGRSTVAMYLRTAEHLFCHSDFRYVAQWCDDRSAVLEFQVSLDGVHIEGVDIIHWNDDDQITSFKVMVRPLKGMQAVMGKMGELLARAE